MRSNFPVIIGALLVIAAPHACGESIAAQSQVAPFNRQSVVPPSPAARDTLFDFLVGDWRVEATPRVSKLAAFVHGVPRYTGHWRGRRTEAGVSDELRVADAGGTTQMLLRFERLYDAPSRSWSVREIDRDGASSARLKPILTKDAITLLAATRMARTRFVERTPTRFRYLREVSNDGGRTWEEPVFVVTATRIPDTRSRHDDR